MGVARQPSTPGIPGSRRLRRRGPRSTDSLARRAERSKRMCPGKEDPGKSRVETSPIELKMQPLNILSVNIRSLMGKLDELCASVTALGVNLILVQESWLDASIVNPVLPNFIVLCRRDRSERANRGGVIVYISSELNNVVAYKESEHAERLWCLVHRDSGSIAICNWYLPPRSKPCGNRFLR